LNTTIIKPPPKSLNTKIIKPPLKTTIYNNHIKLSKIPITSSFNKTSTM
jgi:hypothetical protein